jgi:hypothetical protein
MSALIKANSREFGCDGFQPGLDTAGSLEREMLQMAGAHPISKACTPGLKVLKMSR